jgi:hypothetical protein
VGGSLGEVGGRMGRIMRVGRIVPFSYSSSGALIGELGNWELGNCKLGWWQWWRGGSTFSYLTWSPILTI